MFWKESGTHSLKIGLHYKYDIYMYSKYNILKS